MSDHIYFKGNRAIQYHLAEAASRADAEGSAIRISIETDSDGTQWLTYKIGEGMWSAPFFGDDDPTRD